MQARKDLNVLLAEFAANSLPSATAPSPSDEARLDATIQRVKREAQGSPAVLERFASLSNDELLRTPLPLCDDEPQDADASDASLRQQGDAPFDDVFKSAKVEVDPLRAPLKSGEHPHLRLLPDEKPASPSVPERAATKASRKKIIWVLSGAATLAAAFAVTVRTSHRPLPEPGASLEASPQSSSVVIATNKTNLPSENAVAQKPESVVAPGEPEPVAMANAVSGTPTKASRAAKSETRGAPAAMRAPARAAAAKPMPAEENLEPPLVPAAGPVELVDHPSVGAINAALSRTLPNARRCLPSGAQPVPANVIFGSNGKVTQVVIARNTALEATHESCLIGALRQTQVAPFARAQYETHVTVSAF